MIELLILWNLAAFRSEFSDDDWSVTALMSWILLQVVLWPISLFVVMWKFWKLSWITSLVTTIAVTGLGTLVFRLDFYLVVGFIAVVIAMSYLAYKLVWE